MKPENSWLMDIGAGPAMTHHHWVSGKSDHASVRNPNSPFNTASSNWKCSVERITLKVLLGGEQNRSQRPPLQGTKDIKQVLTPSIVNRFLCFTDSSVRKKKETGKMMIGLNDQLYHHECTNLGSSSRFPV